MDDYVSFGPRSERAAIALRDALASPPCAIEPTVESDADVGSRRPIQPPKLTGVGAAVAFLVIAGAFATAMNHTPPDAARTNAPPSSRLPDPADGWRWDYYRDVRVMAPSSWSYALEPRSDWCVDGGRYVPQVAYVSLGSGDRPAADVDCRGPDGRLAARPPTDLWAPHVSLDPRTADDRPGITENDGWWVVSRPVGDVVVTAVSQDRTIADRIAASAETMDGEGAG